MLNFRLNLILPPPSGNTFGEDISILGVRIRLNH